MASVLMNKGTGSGARPCKDDSQHCSSAASGPMKPPWGSPQSLLHIAFPHFLKCPLLQSAGSCDVLITISWSRWAECRRLLTMGGLRQREAAALLPDKQRFSEHNPRLFWGLFFHRRCDELLPICGTFTPRCYKNHPGRNKPNKNK